MEYRNAQHNGLGGIDCEVNHPAFGWIPFTAEIGSDIYRAAVDVATPYTAPVIDPAAELANWRKTASLPRRNFCLALFGAGILPKNDAIAAAKGDWPTAFDGFLTGLSEQEQAGAQIEWASVQVIRRNHPMIDGLAQLARMTPEQVDAIFGWAG